MIFFLKNLATLIVAIIFSFFVFLFGIPYSIGHAVVMSYKIKWNIFFLLIIRFLNGTLHSFGYLFFHIAKFLDILWCVWCGEAFEDALTTREDTLFGTFITISEATGKEEKEGFLTSFGVWFSKMLNKMFGQSQHCLDALELGIVRKKLESKYYL